MYKGKTGVRLIANLPGGAPKNETNGSAGHGWVLKPNRGYGKYC